MSEVVRLTADGRYIDWKVECEAAWEGLRGMCQDEEEFEKRLSEGQKYPVGITEHSVLSALMDYKGRLEQIITATECHPTEEAKSLNEKARKYLEWTK